MSVFTLVHEIVSRIRVRRNQTHGGAQAAESDSETVSLDESGSLEEPTTWHAGQELQEREEIERVDPRVLITGSKREEWIEGSSVEVRR